MITDLPEKSDCSNTPDAETVDRVVAVGQDEFSSLLISNRNLVRCDAPDRKLRGLYDPASRTRFTISETHLFAGEF